MKNRLDKDFIDEILRQSNEKRERRAGKKPEEECPKKRRSNPLLKKAACLVTGLGIGAVGGYCASEALRPPGFQSEQDVFNAAKDTLSQLTENLKKYDLLTAEFSDEGSYIFSNVTRMISEARVQLQGSDPEAWGKAGQNLMDVAQILMSRGVPDGVHRDEFNDDMQRLLRAASTLLTLEERRESRSR